MAVHAAASAAPFIARAGNLHHQLVANAKTMFRPGGKSTAMASDGKVKVHTTWADGSEQVEEYDQKTEQLLTRKLRKKSSVGGEGPWEFEIGEAPPRPSEVGIVENPDNPVCVRRDTRRQFQWRVRNIAFPVEVYQVTVSPEEHSVTIRTSNKKWYKKLIIPDTQRSGCQVKARLESFAPRPLSTLNLLAAQSSYFASRARQSHPSCLC